MTKQDIASTGWGHSEDAPTTLILLRHGVTPLTDRKVFSGRSGHDPGLTDVGLAQAGRAAVWLERLDTVDAIVSSPLLRTRETAAVVADRLGLSVDLEPGVAEASFGDWDGFTFAEIAERWPTDMRDWLASTAVAPPGGEPFDAVDVRVSEARERLVSAYAGKTVVVVSHVTPIKLFVRHALGAPISVIYTMELSPASLSTTAWWPGGKASLRGFNVVPD